MVQVLVRLLLRRMELPLKHRRQILLAHVTKDVVVSTLFVGLRMVMGLFPMNYLLHLLVRDVGMTHKLVWLNLVLFTTVQAKGWARITPTFLVLYPLTVRVKVAGLVILLLIHRMTPPLGVALARKAKTYF